jgi:hypothetical protein
MNNKKTDQTNTNVQEDPSSKAEHNRDKSTGPERNRNLDTDLDLEDDTR